MEAAVEEQRDRLGLIADRRIGLLHEPLRKARELQRPGVKKSGRQQPLQAPASQEEQCPRGIGRGCRAQILDDGRYLGVGGGRPIERVVEISECLHVTLSHEGTKS